MILLLGLHLASKNVQQYLQQVFLKPAYRTLPAKVTFPKPNKIFKKFKPKLRISFKIKMVNIGYISNSGNKGRKNCREIVLGNLLRSILELRGTSVIIENMSVILSSSKSFYIYIF